MQLSSLPLGERITVVEEFFVADDGSVPVFWCEDRLGLRLTQTYPSLRLRVPNWESQLNAQQSHIPARLRYLVHELFAQGIILECAIKKTQLTLTITYRVPVEQAFNRFRECFEHTTKLTVQPIRSRSAAERAVDCIDAMMRRLGLLD